MPVKASDLAKIRPHEELYIALQELDFSWYPHEVERVIEMWERGTPIWDMSVEFGRCQEEVFLLLLDLAMNGRVKRRPGGICGVGNRV